jgi:hypothetical protein
MPSSYVRLLPVLVVVVGNKVGDSEGRVAVCIVDVCRISEKVVDTAVRVSDDDDAVCDEIAGDVDVEVVGVEVVDVEVIVDVEVVTPCMGSEERGVEEETGGEEDADVGSEGVM